MPPAQAARENRKEVACWGRLPFVFGDEMKKRIFLSVGIAALLLAAVLVGLDTAEVYAGAVPATTQQTTLPPFTSTVEQWFKCNYAECPDLWVGDGGDPNAFTAWADFDAPADNAYNAAHYIRAAIQFSEPITVGSDFGIEVDFTRVGDHRTDKAYSHDNLDCTGYIFREGHAYGGEFSVCSRYRGDEFGGLGLDESCAGAYLDYDYEAVWLELECKANSKYPLYFHDEYEWRFLVNGEYITSTTPGCIPITDVSINGPVTITQGELEMFEAVVSPANATPPISYTWNTQNTAPQPPPGESQPSENPPTVNDPYFGFFGAVPGTYTVTVEASNCGGSASDSVTVTVISSYVPPFPVVDCDFPTLFIYCQTPAGSGIGEWIMWLWCNQEGWFEYFVGIWLYILCMLYRPFAIVGNGIGEIIYTLYTNLGQSIFNLALFFLDWFSKFGQFLLMLVEEVPVCIAGTFGWIANWINVSGPGLSAFIEMAVPESVAWLSSLLSWFATDFLTASFGAILEVLATVINNSSDTTQFLLDQFAATIIDAVRMIGYVIVMVTFVLDLLTALVIALNAALSSDTTPDMFEELTYFWRGLDFFEEVVGESPLALLNIVALGLMAITLIYWTIGQVAGLIDDMMAV